MYFALTNNKVMLRYVENKIMIRQGSYTNLSRGPMLFSTSTILAPLDDSAESKLDVFSSGTIPGCRFFQSSEQASIAGQKPGKHDTAVDGIT